MKKTIVIYKERLWKSFASDLITFAFLALCIWFSESQGGGWWTFFTSTMFLIALSAKVSIASSRIVKINNKAEAVKWANGLADEVDSTCQQPS